MSDDVSRETPGHDETPEHQVIEREVPQNLYDPRTKTVKPRVIEYRADGCITSRAGS